ncbi:MAG: class I SAM-dependent methyltransferase [Verrucomicrobiae bacterium]|nr:class I SAM-dependent methyltransferase [Verrucomicrobiae bacterium]
MPEDAPRTQRWSDVSDDPNSPQARAFRAATLKAAHRPPVADKVGYLQDLARGKRVLDIGVVDHTLDNQAKPQWLHRAIASSASYCLGVDILAEPVKTLQAAGYNVRVCDVTKDPLGEQFDVMICGDVIEHLGNPAGLFEAARRHLVPGGRLVVSTPNPFCLFRIKETLAGRSYENVDHVSFLFPSGIAELAERAGLRLDSYRGVRPVAAPTPLARLFRLVKPLLLACGWPPECDSETIIYECVNPPH